jgi:hypothetical protein
MDRLKLETVYLRALDALMSAVDEYQIQAAIFRLRRPTLAAYCGKRDGVGREHVLDCGMNGQESLC